MRPLIQLLLFCLAVVLTACGGSTPQQPEPDNAAIPTQVTLEAPTATILPTPTVSRERGTLRILHAVPDGPQINVLLDEAEIARQMRYTTYTQPTETSAGEHTLSIVPVDTTNENPQPLLTQAITVAPNSAVIVVFTGTADAPALSVFPENSEALSPNESRVSFIHAIPRGVDVTLYDSTTPLTDPVPFGQISSAYNLPTGTHTLEFRAGDSLLTTFRLNALPRTTTTLALIGKADDPTSLRVIEFATRVPGQSQLRVVNAAPDLPAIDAYLNESSFAQTIESGGASLWETRVAGTYTLALYPAGTNPATDAPLLQETFNAGEDQALTLTLMGSANALRLIPVQEDLSPVRPGFARIVFVNSLEGSPRSRITIGGGTLENAPPLGYGEASTSAQIEAGTTSFYWNEALDQLNGARIEAAENVTLEAGRAYLYLLTGVSVDAPPLILSEPIPINEQLAGLAVDVTPSATPRVPARARLVNALADGVTADLSVAVTPLVTGIPAGEGSAFVAVPADLQILNLTNSADQAFLTSIEYEFRVGRDYTVYAYGSVTFGVELLLVEERDIPRDEANAHFRLINLSTTDETPLALGYTPGVVVGAEPILESPSARPALPADTALAINDLLEGGISAPAQLPVGTVDFQVIDPETRTLAASLRGVTLEANRFYDIVVYEEVESRLVRAFLVPYP
ncbi:MAG: DUF4397 domain-containing protein [bacterium]|nr:DUF4397 domain-containing protein [bacterium]